MSPWMATRTVVILTAASVVALAPIGCSSSRQTTARTPVAPGDFRRPDAPAAATPAPLPAAPPPAATAGADVIVLSGTPSDPAGAGNPRVITLGASDAPVTDDPETRTTPPGDGVGAPTGAGPSGYVVDALLGQVNGRPIYAAEFLEPMDARLSAESARMDVREWQRLAAGEIASALRDMLQDELLLAEFRASLSEQERVGIGAFIDRVRQGLISQSGGSREVARTRLLEDEGLTLNQKVDDEVKRAFIREQIKREIADSVRVGFRDIELYYEQNPAEFAPPPTAVFRIVRAPLEDSERLARIEEALSRGENFVELAAREGDYNPSLQGILEMKLDTPALADATVFGPAPLNEAVRALEVGEVSPRTDFAGSAWWIRLEQLNRALGRSLYEAQFEIEQKIRTQRLAQAERRYFQRVLGRAGIDDQQEVAIRLLEFAVRRYQLGG